MRLLSASELIENAPYEAPLSKHSAGREKQREARISGRDLSLSSHPKNLVYHMECAYSLE